MRLSSLGKPRNAKRRFLGRIFLSYPHTHGRFIQCVTPSEFDIYIRESKIFNLTSYKDRSLIKLISY